MEEAIRKFHGELSQIHGVKKCKACTCFYEVLEDLEKALSTIDEKKMKRIRRDIAAWRKEREQLKLHGCLGCDPCLPVVPSNRFYDEVTKQKPEKSSKLICELASRDSWPPVVGDYYVGNKKGSVAVCTLSSDELLDGLKESLSHLKGLAIVGKLATENLGIEKIIQNVVSNPNIRFLILCGHDPQGHHPGQAILALVENDIDTQGKIIGAKGARPLLRNVTQEHVEAFRLQVQVVDLIGNTDMKGITDQISACSHKNLGSFYSTVRMQWLAEIVASHDRAKEFVADPSGFFTILVDHKVGKIIVEHYSNDFRLTHITNGKKAEDICATIIRLGLVSRLDHAAYLGRELQKAENALRLQLVYEQEKA